MRTDLEAAIGARAARLARGRQQIRQDLENIRECGLGICRKPSTLAGAGLAGAVVGYAYPPGRLKPEPARGDSGGTSRWRKALYTAARMLAVRSAFSLFDPSG